MYLLRQGDPLSPYLFILCADVLSGLLSKEAILNNIHGIQVARQAPKISHLLFADDSLLFARANTVEAERILKILHSYQRASGQVVNLDKSEASFSRNVRDEEKEMICNQMNVKTMMSHTRYLGLPVVFGRSKKEIFSFVIDRVWKKLKGWKEIFLSRAGKEVLIKAVAQAISSYIMSCYKLPEGCCNEIEGLLARFWWGAKEGERKIHWMSWERLSKAKIKEGMGFRGISDFNKALLGKHCWRLLTGEDTLMGKIFKSRYHPRGSFLDAKLGFSPSYAWRTIMSARELIMKGSKWRIGYGEKVRIWHDNWIPSKGSTIVQSRTGTLQQDAYVSALIDQDTKQWNRDSVFSNFNSFESRLIVSIPLSCRLLEDSLVWFGEKDGKYSVRSAYHLLGDERKNRLPRSSHGPHEKLWKEIWRVNLPNRVKNFIWRLSKNILPIRANLCKKGIKIEPLCPMCNSATETVQHLFMECNFSKLNWFSSSLGIHVPSNCDLNNWLLGWLEKEDMLGSQLFCTTMWKMWSYRNQVVFNQISPYPPAVANAALDFIVEFNHTNEKKRNQLQPHGAAAVAAAPSLVYNAHVIQVDAGCFPEGFTTFGCVFKDGPDSVYFLACNKEEVSTEPVLDEALAIRWCLQLAKEKGLQDVTIQYDALAVVECFRGSNSLASIDLIVLDVRPLWKILVVCLLIMFVET